MSTTVVCVSNMGDVSVDVYAVKGDGSRRLVETLEPEDGTEITLKGDETSVEVRRAYGPVGNIAPTQQ